MRVHNFEPWFTPTLTPEVQNHIFWPGGSGMLRMDQYGSMFELWRANRVVVHYFPAVGTTANGILHMGADFDAFDYVTTRNSVAILTPQHTGPIWNSGTMSIPPDRINRSRWMYTNAGITNPTSDSSRGFLIATAITGTDLPGEVWVEYELDFSGPVAGAQTDSFTQEVQVYSQINNDGTDFSSGPTIGRNVRWFDLRGQNSNQTSSTATGAINGQAQDYRVTINDLLPDMAYNVAMKFYRLSALPLGNFFVGVDQGQKVSESTIYSSNAPAPNAVTEYMQLLTVITDAAGALQLHFTNTGDGTGSQNVKQIINLAISTVGGMAVSSVKNYLATHVLPTIESCAACNN
jgi:hypothetical protein